MVLRLGRPRDEAGERVFRRFVSPWEQRGGTAMGGIGFGGTPSQ